MPAKPPVTEDTLKRERAGTYQTNDGRFTVEQSSSGWLVYDGEQADELGLPLARGPFPTLDGAKAGLAAARRTAAPGASLPRTLRRAPARARSRPARQAQPAGPARAPVVIRDIRAVDGEALRAMWTAAGFGLLGDDDLGLARLARRNPGLVLVASEGTRVVGSAVGAWDGRRGWIYHLAVAPSHRRQGIATRLIDEVEKGLRALGCRKANVMLRPDSVDGAAFWDARGYATGNATQLGKELGAD